MNTLQEIASGADEGFRDIMLMSFYHQICVRRPEAMADPELVEILKRGVTEWNEWRHSEGWKQLQQQHSSWYHQGFRPALSRAILEHADLENADLRFADLSSADLGYANLRRVSLAGAELGTAYFYMANLTKAILVVAHLVGADFQIANLKNANLTQANLMNAKFVETNLDEANLSKAVFGDTILANVDLSRVKGLETALHHRPSIVNINSVTLPHDEPTRLHFSRGVGFTETQIEYLPSLLTPRPIEYSSLFISYSHKDDTIAKRLYNDLRRKDVPCWFAPHDLRPATLIVRGIEEAIHKQDKLLLILSRHAMTSNWVQYEVESALHKQVTTGRETLFPIRLDNAILESKTEWARRLRKHNIGDFTNWQEEESHGLRPGI